MDIAIISSSSCLILLNLYTINRIRQTDLNSKIKLTFSLLQMVGVVTSISAQVYASTDIFSWFYVVVVCACLDCQIVLYISLEILSLFSVLNERITPSLIKKTHYISNFLFVCMCLPFWLVQSIPSIYSVDNLFWTMLSLGLYCFAAVTLSLIEVVYVAYLVQTRPTTIKNPAQAKVFRNVSLGNLSLFVFNFGGSIALVNILLTGASTLNLKLIVLFIPGCSLLMSGLFLNFLTLKAALGFKTKGQQPKAFVLQNKQATSASYDGTDAVTSPVFAASELNTQIRNET